MNKEKRIVTLAKKAKRQGYTYVISVVKSIFNTTYWHVVKIDDIISKKQWIPASFHNFGWHGRIGTTTPPLGQLSITRQELYRLK